MGKQRPSTVQHLLHSPLGDRVCLRHAWLGDIVNAPRAEVLSHLNDFTRIVGIERPYPGITEAFSMLAPYCIPACGVSDG